MNETKCATCRRTFLASDMPEGVCARCDAPARKAREAAREAEIAAFYAAKGDGPCDCSECREHDAEQFASH